MSLFKKHLARLSKAEEMDHSQDDPAIENEKDDMPIMSEASLGLEAEDANPFGNDDDEDDEPFNAAADDDSEDKTVDPVVDDVADEVEAAIESVMNEVKAELKKAKASTKVAGAVIEGLRGWGFLMKNPLAAELKKAKFTKAEQAFIKKLVLSAKESAEDILKAASLTLIQNKKTLKHAKQLDQVLMQDGYIRSRIANPLILSGTVKKAENAISKTRKARRTLK